jgi:hypothetical protein
LPNTTIKIIYRGAMDAAHSSTHQDVDRRILRLIEACVEKIEITPWLLERARAQANRYSNPALRREWHQLLDLPWANLRGVLLEQSEQGDRIRQSAPFGGFLSNEERIRILKSS